MTRGQAASEGEIHKTAPPNTCRLKQLLKAASPQLREKVPPVFDRIEGLVEIVQGNLAALVVFGCYPNRCWNMKHSSPNIGIVIRFGSMVTGDDW